MKIQWLVWIVLVFTPPASGQSLADAVKQERERRAKLQAPDESVVYTNADLEKLKNAGHVTSNSPYDPMLKGKGGSDKGQNARSWQSRMIRVEEKIKTLRSKIEGYEKQIRDSGGAPVEVRSRTSIGARGRTRVGGRSRAHVGIRSWTPHANRRIHLEQRKAKAERDLQRALDEKHRIEEEARKAGVLPGVLRGQR